jgi:hypothetical protein
MQAGRLRYEKSKQIRPNQGKSNPPTLKLPPSLKLWRDKSARQAKSDQIKPERS